MPYASAISTGIESASGARDDAAKAMLTAADDGSHGGAEEAATATGAEEFHGGDGGDERARARRALVGEEQR